VLQTTRRQFTDINLSLDPELCNPLSGESRNELLDADQVISLLSPIYLPCGLQHSLLAQAQNLLEDCLFRFGTSKMQEVIKDKGWDCARCVELNDWVKILRRRKDLLNNFKVRTSHRPLSVVLGSLVQLRHTAVHRQRITALEVQLYLEDAGTLLDLLGDEEAAKDMSDINCSLSDHLKDLSAHFKLSEEKLRVIAREKRTQTFQLQLEEHSAVSQILAENQNFERNATARLKPKTLRGNTLLARDVPSSAPFQDDECARHITQKTFQICASCIEDIQTRTRAAVESSSTCRNTPTCLSQRLFFSGITEIIYYGLTCVPRKTQRFALVLVLLSFGTLLWLRRRGNEDLTETISV